MERSADSAVKKKTGRQGSQSLRSSDSRHPSSAIDEYRRTSIHTGLGTSKKRSRHHKKVAPPDTNGGLDQESDKASSQKTTTQPHFKAPGRRLMSQLEHPSDHIEDDEPQVTSGEAQPTRVNGRVKAPYAKTLFAPVIGSFSDDELGSMTPQLPKTKMRDRMSESTKSSNQQGKRTNNGLKRAAESPDVLQDEHPTKRRQEYANEVDLRSTNSVASSMRHVRGQPEILCVIKAACLPELCYPATEDLRGPTNKKCYLSPPTRDSPEKWTAVDEKGVALPELWWITPAISKITAVSWKPTSSIVRLKQSLDFGRQGMAGASLLIEFGTASEANKYYDQCLRAIPTIKKIKAYVLATIRNIQMFADISS